MKIFILIIFYCLPIILKVNGIDNIALQKQVYMSSVYPGSEAKSLTDGNRNSDWAGQSCAATDEGPYGENWIVVDLAQEFKVTRVVVYNRMDCCSERESNLIVGLMTTFIPNMKIDRASYPRCGVFVGTALNVEKLEINCANDAPQARYVVVQQPAYSFGNLNICELEVFTMAANIIGADTALNLALRKQVYMSSVYPGSEAKSLTDGNRNSDWAGQSCAATDEGPYGANWIVVDLGQSYKVKKVVVYNRMDCCSERESNLIVGLMSSFSKDMKLDRQSYPRCGVFSGSSLNVATLEVNCDSTAPPSRYLILQQPMYSNGYLNVCEIEVFA